MQILKSENLHVQAYNIIKKAILEGQYRPGERIKEIKLAEILGVSRGPVREAIRILVQEGLLVQIDGPLCVYKPTFQDLVDLYQCRESLESLASGLAAKHITDEESEELSSILRQTREAIAANNRLKIIQLNTMFHDKIINASRNKELINVLNTIRSKVLFMRNNGHQAYFREDDFIDEHEAVYRMILARDEVNAMKEMKLHIQKDIEKFYALIEKNQGGNSSFLK
jgi:DNA-binding GntR family transcriptional regulator